MIKVLHKSFIQNICPITRFLRHSIISGLIFQSYFQLKTYELLTRTLFPILIKPIKRSTRLFRILFI